MKLRATRCLLRYTLGVATLAPGCSPSCLSLRSRDRGRRRGLFCGAGQQLYAAVVSEPNLVAAGGITGSGSEVVWSPGGGGFSNYFAPADYQTTARAMYVPSPV